MRSEASQLMSRSPPGMGPGLSQEASEDETRRKVLRAVRGCPEGISTQDIARAAGVSPPTVVRILKDLEREREVYGRSHTRRNIMLWYPNGRMVHPFLELFKEIRGKTYRATVQEGRSGPAIQLQERTYSLLHGERIEGAIFVDYPAVDELIELLQQLKSRYESLESVKGQVE